MWVPFFRGGVCKGGNQPKTPSQGGRFIKTAAKTWESRKCSVDFQEYPKDPSSHSEAASLRKSRETTSRTQCSPATRPDPPVIVVARRASQEGYRRKTALEASIRRTLDCSVWGDSASRGSRTDSQGPKSRRAQEDRTTEASNDRVADGRKQEEEGAALATIRRITGLLPTGAQSPSPRCIPARDAIVLALPHRRYNRFVKLHAIRVKVFAGGSPKVMQPM